MKRLLAIDSHPNVQEIYLRISAQGGKEGHTCVLDVFLHKPSRIAMFCGDDGARSLPDCLERAEKMLQDPEAYFSDYDKRMGITKDDDMSFLD